MRKREILMVNRTTWQALDHVKSLLTDGPMP